MDRNAVRVLPASGGPVRDKQGSQSLGLPFFLGACPAVVDWRLVWSRLSLAPGTNPEGPRWTVHNMGVQSGVVFPYSCPSSTPPPAP